MIGPNTQSAYKVTSGEACVAGVLRAFGCTAQEHEHPEAQLTILFRGSAPSVVAHDESGRTKRTGIVTDSFVFVAPGQPHRLNWENDGEVLHLWMPDDALMQLCEQAKCPIPSSVLGHQPDRAIYEIGRMLMDEFNETAGLSPTMVNHAMSLMVSRVLRTSERLAHEIHSSFLSLKRLGPAIDFMNDCPERDFTLLELARMCNSSVFHFARSFRARTGCAPFAMQRTLRCEKAKKLLRATGLSVEAVGAAVGIGNATHFSRLFRRQTGYSPREYRHLQGQRA